jgi:hypothetical protein
MTATSTPTLDMLPNTRNVAAVIAKDASENLAGVDVVSIGPLYGEQTPARHAVQSRCDRSRARRKGYQVNPA